MVTDDKQEKPLVERVEEARKGRKMPSREGHEVSAAGKEVRTPDRDEFFGNLEKATSREARTKHEREGA